MLTSFYLHRKSSYFCIKARSTPALLLFQGPFHGKFLSFALQYNLTWRRGNFRLFCSFNSKLPRIQVRLHWNANEKNKPWKGLIRPIYTVRLCRMRQRFTTWFTIVVYVRKKCRIILKHVLKRNKSCRRPVVSLSHATKSYHVNRPLDTSKGSETKTSALTNRALKPFRI